MSKFRVIALFCVGVACAAHGSIRRIVVESQTVLPLEQTSGVAYEQIRGIAYGDLDPAGEHNTVIQDLSLAPKNAAGRVEYAETFTLLLPRDHTQSSGYLVYEVVNRGASILPRDYSSHDTFLRSGWQGDLPFRGNSVYGGAAETISLPTAHHPDGSPVTGPALLRFLNVRTAGHSIATRNAVGYATSGKPPLPLDLETAHANLVTRAFEGLNGALGASTPMPSDAWRWADCSTTPFPGVADPASICLRDGFSPDLVYEVQYTAKDPLVLGIGLAAIRDTVSFFAHSRTDDTGWANPVAQGTRFVLGAGASQSGNTLRTFLNLGFNQDESGRQVFDGVMPMIAARQNPVNFRFAIPGGASSLYEPGSDGVVWWSDWTDGIRHHPRAGLLSRCTATRTCPKITEILGSSEFWSLRASPDFTGTDNRQDIPLPPNVRRYYVASTQHGGGTGGFRWQPANTASPRVATADNPIAAMGCVLPLNPNPEREINRAILVALKQWVAGQQQPPPSVYPTLHDGMLVPANADAMHFPAIPGFPSPDGVANPLLVYDFGSTFQYNDLSGVIALEPPAITATIPPLVPRVDADGNEVGGIHTVLQQAALGTYTGWNVTVEGFQKGQYCSLYGSYKPFAKTREERLAAHDPRLSLEERYGSQKGYMCVVRKAAADLVQRRLMLSADADAMVRQASAAAILPESASAAYRQIEAQQCGKK